MSAWRAILISRFYFEIVFSWFNFLNFMDNCDILTFQGPDYDQEKLELQKLIFTCNIIFRAIRHIQQQELSEFLWIFQQDIKKYIGIRQRDKKRGKKKPNDWCSKEDPIEIISETEEG